MLSSLLLCLKPLNILRSLDNYNNNETVIGLHDCLDSHVKMCLLIILAPDIDMSVIVGSSS